MRRIGIAAADFGYNLHDWRWGVFSFVVMLAKIAKQLCDLREVNIGPKMFLQGHKKSSNTLLSHYRDGAQFDIRIARRVSFLAQMTSRLHHRHHHHHAANVSAEVS